MRRRLALLAAAVALPAIALGFAGRHGGPPGESWETQRVRRADAVSWLRETGTLAPRDPVVVAVPFDGRLQWVVEDATWVQQGEPLFIISDDDELKKVADERQQLEEARQDRELATLKLSQSAETEERKVRKAQDDLDLEHARHRILTDPAKGGLELVRLDAELRPKADATAEVRIRAEAAREAWQRLQDAYLDRLDEWQQHQDALLALENRLDELDAREREAREQPTAAMKRQQHDRDAGRVEGDAAVVDPAEARRGLLAERSALLARTPALRQALDAARTARGAAAIPKDESSARLRTAEAEERELRIRIEVEKRRLPATQLELDLRLAEVADAEAARRLAEGEAELRSRVLSRAAYDDLLAVAEQARTQLSTTRERLAIAARPPGPEALAEAAARLAKAEQTAAQAEAVRDRNLEIQRQEVAVLDARIARLSASLAVRARRFPSTIEQEIAARERERDLRPEAADHLAAEIAALKADLEKARTAPPNFLVAPTSGLVRVRKEGDRQKLAGDQAWQADPMCEVFPPENMEVVVRVNEVNVPKLRPGMRVTAEIPALGRLPRTGTVGQIAGVGRDKNDLLGRKGPSGVTQYETRIVLDPGGDGRDGDFRQGMTALVAVELERATGALVVPQEAVERMPGGWGVHRDRGSALTPITGRAVGDELFVVEQGLGEGDEVHVRRIADR